MPILSHPAFGPRAALIYITSGAILDIFVACFWFFLVDKSKPLEENNVVYFWLTSLFLVGLTLLVIGLILGRIGQSARRAELPPPEALPAEAAVQQQQAANLTAAIAPAAVVAPPVGVAPAAAAAQPAPAGTVYAAR